MAIYPLTLTNPGAETGNTTGWTLGSGSWNWSAVNSVGGPNPVAPHSGSYLFGCAFNAAVTIYQQVDISAYATAIDAGTGGAYARAYQNAPDANGPGCELFISAIAADGVTVLGTVNLEGYQRHTGGWYPREEWYKGLPTGTRALRIGIVNQQGSSGVPCWDDFYLEFSDAYGTDYPTLLRVSQGALLTAWLYPTADTRVSQAAALTAIMSNTRIRVSQSAVLVLWRGRTQNPKLRAWTFTLDGHDFFVLKLGTMGTLLYDLSSGQWVDWDAFSEIYWPVSCGFNWIDGQGVTDSSGSAFGSNVVVGDDTYPLLWILEPLQPYDESPNGPLDPKQQYYFTRMVQGQIPAVGREALPCYAAWLTTDMGAPAYVGASVTLEISDDAGASYQNMGTVMVTAGNNFPEIAWYSLGQIMAPGRLFRITDDGAVARIDTLEMNDPDDAPGKR